jgi:ABC-type transport system involved in multi-copper enzyme maturation permease subunit
LIGPVFTRELVTAPRRTRFYLSRALYVGGLLILVSTAWGLYTGTQNVRTLADTARFGAAIFQILSVLQLTLALFFAALLTASAVAQEKDRRTLVLLLLTHLSNSELVLGKMLASVLNVLLMLLTAVPFFMMVALFGGVSFAQIARVFLVAVATVLAAGSLGSMIALAREKTFLSLATTTLILFFWLAAWTAVAAGLFAESWLGISAWQWSAMFSPLQAAIEAARPVLPGGESIPMVRSPVYGFVALTAALTVLLNGWAILRVRVWNPSRESAPRQEETEPATLAAPAEAAQGSESPRSGVSRSVHAAPGKTRAVWENPVLWREVCTWAYGRRVLLVHLAFIAICIAAGFVVQRAGGQLLEVRPNGLQYAALQTQIAMTLAPLFVLSLVLVNALAVNSVTGERDLGALDLLLVTDISPYEFVFGKLGGIFWLCKWIILPPLLLCIALWWSGAISFENLFYLVIGLLIMDAFVAMLGVHVGMAYSNSRTAVAVSLGTVFFLFLGIATAMRIMVSFSGSFQMQLMPFMAVMFGGTAGLYAALGLRNPSPAIFLAALACPAATFVAITSYLNGQTLGVFVIVALAYGFATLAMLVPALAEFDVATGRTTNAGE